MTLSEWVLLQGLLGLFVTLNTSLRVDAASLGGHGTANETYESRVCAHLSKIALAGGKYYELLDDGIGRRQFKIQSNNVVANKKKDLVSFVRFKETLRDADDACPIKLYRHHNGVCCCFSKIFNFNYYASSLNSNKFAYFKVPPGLDNLTLKQIQQNTRKDNENLFNVEDDNSARDKKSFNKNQIHSKIYIGWRITRSLMDENVASIPRGGSLKSDVIGERKVKKNETVVDILERPFVEADLKINMPLEEKEEEEAACENEDIPEFDLEEFCKIECPKGNGGIVCGCDLLPF